MVRQRRPVQSLQEALSTPIRPAAAPVQQASTVAPPPELPIYDFASISRTLSGVLARQQQQRNRERVQEGERYVEENRELVADLESDLAGVEDPKERDRLQKETFAFWQRNGVIPPAADPNWRVGYHRATGRVMAGKYWQALQARLDEVTLVKNKDGTPNLRPVEPEAIMADEWAKIAQSPSIKDFYGGQEALAEKQRADGQFLERVTARRSQAEEENYVGVLSQETADAFDAILLANDVVTSETLQPITNKLTREFEEHNVLNPRQIVMQALELSIRRKSAVDPDEAIRTIHAAQDLVVGGVRLGDDRGEAGLRLEELTRQVGAQAKADEDRELRNEDRVRQTLIQRAENDYLPLFQQARRDGQSVMAVADRLEEQYVREDAELGSHQGRVAFVVDAMRETALAMDSERRDDAKTVSDLNVLIADGDVDSAGALADSALRRGALTGETYAGTKKAIRERQDVSQHVEGSELYRSVLTRYRQSSPDGYAGETQERLNSENIERERALNQDFAAWVRVNQGSPTLEKDKREWLEARERTDLVPVRARSEELRLRQAKVVTSVRDRQARYQGAEDLIARGLEDGSLTTLAAQELREEDIKTAANKQNLVNQAFADSADILKAGLTSEFGGPPTSPDQVAIQTEANRLLLDQLDLAIDGVLSDPAADPRSFPARVRAEGRRVVDEVSDKLFPTERGAIKLGLESGEGVTKTEQKVQRLTADRGLGEILTATLADPVSRSQLSHTDTIFAPAGADGGTSLRAPGVPDRFYDYVAAWWSGRDPIFGTPVLREDVEHQVRQMRQQGADDEATLAALDLVGIDAVDVLRGELNLEPDLDGQAEATEQLARLEAGIRAGIAQPTANDQIQELKARLEPIRIPLGEHELRPYITPFFRSREAFNAFSDDPAYPELLRRLGIPEDLREEWESHQLDAIERSAQ